MNFIKGPDFPTGGIIVDKAEVNYAAYTIGRGSLRVRSRWKKSYGTYQIVVTEIPYQVQKSKLLEQIAILLKDKKFPLLAILEINQQTL